MIYLKEQYLEKQEVRKVGALPKLVIKGKEIRFPIIQGGMGVGVSRAPLAAAVAREGGAGIISSAGLKTLWSREEKRNYSTFEAVFAEISQAKAEAENDFIGLNAMVALVNSYEETIQAAFAAKVDAIISGAGLPLNLPSFRPSENSETALIPIVSSAKALNVICARWRGRYDCLPDAVVLEGPLAGGHLGFKLAEIALDENRLENLLPAVLKTAKQYGDFPIIVAGGIFSRDDIDRFLSMGANGVQMGTRFLATEESGAPPTYKQAVIEAKEEDIFVSPDSPCGMPFRTITSSPALNCQRSPKCGWGYVRWPDGKGGFKCKAADNGQYFCICEGLLSSAGSLNKKPLYTVGTNAYRVDKILSVSSLMAELTELT